MTERLHRKPALWGIAAGMLAGMSLAATPLAAVQQNATTGTPAKRPDLSGHRARVELAYRGPGPSNLKANKAFEEAIEYVKKGMPKSAAGDFLKALKADPACVRCAEEGIELALENGEYKSAIEMAATLGAATADPSVKRFALFEEGIALSHEGMDHFNTNLLEQADARFVEMLKKNPHDGVALFEDGRVLARLGSDAEAKARFQEFLASTAPDDPDHGRAERYEAHPELLRLRIAPSFRVTALKGQTVSTDQGKVMVIDFWTARCAMCNEELTHLKRIAAQYAGRPLVVLSVSGDLDEATWKDFVAENAMSWPQYRDSDNRIAKMFGMKGAADGLFTIDADGVLYIDQFGGGHHFDEKLKKLVIEAEKKMATGRPVD